MKYRNSWTGYGCDSNLATASWLVKMQAVRSTLLVGFAGVRWEDVGKDREREKREAIKAVKLDHMGGSDSKCMIDSCVYELYAYCIFGCVIVTVWRNKCLFMCYCWVCMYVGFKWLNSVQKPGSRPHVKLNRWLCAWLSPQQRNSFNEMTSCCW